MGTATTPLTAGISQFTISYPYYGLFRTAVVRVMKTGEELIFECRLIDGVILWLKKRAQSRQWIDAQANAHTTQASLIGQYIDDFLIARK
jgi:hypothetical protein